MICCNKCFNDSEIQALIVSLNHQGDCPICKSKNVFLYDSEIDRNKIGLEEHLTTILEIYKPNSSLPSEYPENEKISIEDRLLVDWDIFTKDRKVIKTIVKNIIDNSFNLDNKILYEKVGIPELFDEEFLFKNSCMGKYTWEDFKKI